MQVDNPARPLGLRTRLSYGFGSVAFGVKDNGFAYFLQFFYAQVVGLPSASVGFAIMIALIIDAVMDPIVGQISDNTHTKWGRRHPFMYAAALPVAVSYLLLWNPPTSWSQPALVAYLVVTTICIRTFITCYEIPSAALSAELTTDYDERTRLLSYRHLFGWLGGITMYVLAMSVFLRPEGGVAGQLNAAGYHQYGLFAALLMFIAILISSFGTHNRIPYLAQPTRRILTLRQWLGEMGSTLAHKTFLSVLGASFFNAMALGLYLSITLYFVTYFWQFSSAQAATIGGSAVIAAFLAFWLAPRLSARMDKRPVTIALILVAMFFTALPIVLRLLDIFPANGSAVLFWLVFALNALSTGLGITGQILFASMIADVVEDSELRTGRRQEGLFFAATAFVNKAVTGAGIFISSLIISLIDFPRGAAPGTVAPEIVRALGTSFVPVLALLYMCACILLMGYGITRRSHQETLRKLSERAKATA
jgi:glycoside/pentoside/hexuronide:cation symporter, GPH family